MGKIKVHYYPHKIGHLKSLCGIGWFDLADHSDNIKYVTCKKCLNKILKK